MIMIMMRVALMKKRKKKLMAKIPSE